MSNWMIYGANGYTGALIAREAKRRGMTPVLAGRNPEACQKVAKELGFEVRVFSCESPATVVENLKGIDLVLHCAGPFSKTSAPMLEACMMAGAHYLDITGEIAVFEAIHSQSDRIRQAGITAIPGVGFDVVPSDCLAAILHEALPDATHLTLAFQSSGTLSPGTAATMIEGLGQSGAVRRDGKIESVPLAHSVRRICFRDRPIPAVSIAWGDVSTAYYSTGIPNIAVYIASSWGNVVFLRMARHFQRALSTPSVKSGLTSLAKSWIHGPSGEESRTRKAYLWGEVTNAKGETRERRLVVPEGYFLTALTAIAAVQKLQTGQIKKGALTPSMAFGSRMICEIPGVELDEGRPTVTSC